ncbi:MAG: hypothetical protein E7C49_01265 [Clostridium sp.]|nr:hypothetical protein [Clostridium sp.]
MPIREKRYKCGKYLEVEIYPISKVEQKKSRERKKKESRKEQKNLNDKNARKKLRRILNANFDYKDLIIHLTYDDKHLPENEEQAIRDRNNYLRRIKNYRKKSGLSDLKYIAVLEYSEADPKDKRTKTRIHHHIVLSGMDRDKVEELWGRGRANADRLQPGETGFEELANYISKDPKGKKRYSPSRNLIIPEGQINDYKFSYKKVYELSKNQGEREEFEKLYPGYVYTSHEVQVNDINSGTYIYIKMRKLD